MKNKLHHLYYLFYPRGSASFRKVGWIILALFLSNVISLAQETPPPGDFHVGTGIQKDIEKYPKLFDAFDTTGFNTISQRADGCTKGRLHNYNLMAVNIRNKAEYIAHYTTAYYSKWEAEQNQLDQSRVGVKHKWGQPAYWNDTVFCWSTLGLNSPKNSVMYGPHYRQDKRYKRWLYDCYSDSGCLTYTPRFRMALDNRWGASSSEDVCILKVVFRYRLDTDTTKYDTTFIQRTLKVGDFDTTGKFDDFYLHPDQSLGWYQYYPNFILPKDLLQIPGTPSSVNYIDWESYTGIQFWVDWLRTDTLCTLYIDYVEVYDNKGWNEYLDPLTHDTVVQNIINYAQSFPASEWPNLINWFGVDEPYSIDCYTPIRVVDELIRSVGAPPLIIHFDPSWWHTFNINGEDEIAVFDSIAKPAKILLGIYPASPDWTSIRPYDYEWLRFNFQRTWVQDSSF
jgi:hypothetical protein